MERDSTPVDEPSRVLAGKVCLVTGSTSGIGAVTARELARAGATVIVSGRSPGRCARAAGQIRACTGGRVEYLAADLSSQAQVRGLAREVARRFRALDVLVNNAGSYFMRRRLSADGLEMTFALNHLGSFLLTGLLFDLLAASPAGRVVNVSSVAHEQGRLDFDDLQGERRYDRLAAYGASKLANLLFTYELARRAAGTQVTANALHPGLVATNLGSDDGWLRTKLRNLLRRGLVAPEEGARTSVWLASSPEVTGISGRYFQECREARSSPASHDRRAKERLWSVSEGLTGSAFLR
ncbi:MAG TPA: SDR family oxidoreductase [Anaeromyxobacteraceae bacterium]|jgi:NAD(P)-dependent dehydrogenase (short-subunit alcohol dehydrogenase family)|nr:SDR family oxidoreductase [Anaeromyxobacteraceae bacterium]